jgi:abortive infection bacteriophage resistance protein
MKKATTIEEQIEILRNRGMSLDIGVTKTEEILSDIGYFRLGFYCFPFEKNYPQTINRIHQYEDDSKISDVVHLYYLDVDLRNILLKYINRIEINFRTNIVYLISNKYSSCNTWFVDASVMERKYIDEFDKKVYTEYFKKNRVIKLHHQKYINDRYAPAWKTLEFLTFGGILTIYKNLKDTTLKNRIASQYNIRNVEVMENYMQSIVEVRNFCAHSSVLFDFTLSRSLKNGPALMINNANKNKLYSVIQVMLYLLKSISGTRAEQMKTEIENILNNFENNTVINDIIKKMYRL